MILEIVLALFDLLAVATITEANVAIDSQYYCDLNCDGKPAGSHVMCAYPSTWGTNCANQAAFINMTDARKKMFVDGHNTRRDILAEGKLPGVFKGKTAVDMAEVIWDSELEMIAQRNLLPCTMAHDQCRRTQRHRFAGQNLAMSCKQPFMTPEEAINKGLDGWWNENKHVDSISATNVYSSIESDVQYGHFTQMGRDKAYAIGCATISTQNGYCYYTACNYAVTNMISDPVYTVGPLRSKCKTKSTKYNGLCSSTENYFDFARHDTQTYFENDESEEVLPVKQWKANGCSHVGNTKGNATPATPPRTRPNPMKRKAPGGAVSATSSTSKSQIPIGQRRIIEPESSRTQQSMLIDTPSFKVAKTQFTFNTDNLFDIKQSEMQKHFDEINSKFKNLNINSNFNMKPTDLPDHFGQLNSNFKNLNINGLNFYRTFGEFGKPFKMRTTYSSSIKR